MYNIKVKSASTVQERILYGIILTLGMGNVGYRILGYPLSIPFALYMSLSVIALISAITSKRINKRRAFYFMMFYFICIFSNTLNSNGVDTYIVSLLILLIFTVPFMIGIPRLNSIKLAKYLKYSILTITMFIGADILTGMIGANADWSSYFSFIMRQDTYYSSSNIYRAKGLMQEPTHLGVVLFFIYVIIDLMNQNNIPSFRKINYLKIIVVIDILLTFSIGPIFIWLFYTLLSNIRHVINLKIRKVAYSIVMVTSLLLLAGTQNSMYYESRISDIERTMTTGSVSGSGGARIQSALLVLRYWENSTILNRLFGEGYSNIQNWTSKQRYLWDSDLLSSGSVQNSITYLFLSTGFMGLLFYSLALGAVFRKMVFRGKYEFIGIIIVFHALSGYLIIYWFWIAIMSSDIINNIVIESRNNATSKYSNRNN